MHYKQKETTDYGITIARSHVGNINYRYYIKILINVIFLTITERKITVAILVYT